MCEVTVIIVNYNSGERLRRCLEALAVQTFKNFETIIIDNASEDGSRAAAETSDDAVKLIRSETNLGFAAANNLGAGHARGRWLATLNPDAYPQPEWLENLLGATTRHPQAAAFGSTQITDANPQILDGAGDVFHMLGIPYRGHFGRNIEALPPEGECFAPCAAAALYRRDVFDAVGGFDERYFCYCEDVDIGFRIRLAGWSAIQVPTAKVAHEGSGVTGRYSDFTVYHGNRNRIWTAYKNIPGALYWALFPVQLAANTYFLVRAAMNGMGRPYWRALVDGYKALPSFGAARRQIQKGRKISMIDAARAMTWSPLKLMQRAADIRPR